MRGFEQVKKVRGRLQDEMHRRFGKQPAYTDCINYLMDSMAELEVEHEKLKESLEERMQRLEDSVCG